MTLATKKKTLELVVKGDATDSPLAKRLSALLDLRLGTPAEFATSARAWADADPNNPDALLCWFHSRVMSEDLERDSLSRLALEGVRVIQAAADQDAVQKRLVRVLQQERQRSGDSQKRSNIQAVLATFQVDGS